MNAIIVILLYILLCVVVYFIVNNDFIAFTNGELSTKKICKLRLSSMIIISGIITLYNWFVTHCISGDVLGSDRYNYLFEFSGYRSPGSVGLEWIFGLISKFGGDIYTVFYFTSFIVIFLMLVAYRKSKIASPKFVLLLLVSEYVFFTFTALKQAYSAAFASLFFVNILEDDTRKGTLLSIFNIVLSIMFHSSGFILIPLFFVLKSDRKDKRKFLLQMAFCTITIIFLPDIMMLVSKIFGSVFPVLATKIGSYFTSTDMTLSGKWTAVFKYFPFVYISFWGVINRKAYQVTVKQFDSILIASVVAGLIVLYSIFLYWFSRFRFTLIFPTYLLYDLMERNEKLRGNLIINNTIVYGMTSVVTLRNVALIMLKYNVF